LLVLAGCGRDDSAASASVAQSEIDKNRCEARGDSGAMCHVKCAPWELATCNTGKPGGDPVCNCSAAK
jgi:hypothetical protein